ncbi:hypothetical protein GCM10010160_12830 [Acrocarpospora corrugata]
MDVVRPDHVTPVEYRALMSGFPTGVSVVTAMDGTGNPHGMTCTSLTSVTVTPPVLLVCLNVRSGTLGAALSSGGFAVNLLHSRGQYAAELFSSPASDRFCRTVWQPSKVVRAPWLVADAFAVAECVIEETMPTGDHVVLLGKVVNVDQSTDVPLLYGLKQFSAWMSESVTYR